MRKSKIQQEFDGITLSKCFEIPVFDKRTSENTYLLFNIHATQRSLVAQCEPTTTKEKKSKKIAHCKARIDKDFSLDSNLTELYEACIDKIIASEFFELQD
jgi:hypothetical protein